MYSLCFKLYTNYTQNPTLQLERQRVKETKRLRVGESTVNGQRSTVKETKRQKDKKTKRLREEETKRRREEERKRGRDKGRKNSLFETFYPPIFKPTTWLSNCFTFTKREREAPLSWYPPPPPAYSLGLYIFNVKVQRFYSFDQINHHLFPLYSISSERFPP